MKPLLGLPFSLCRDKAWQDSLGLPTWQQQGSDLAKELFAF